MFHIVLHVNEPPKKNFKFPQVNRYKQFISYKENAMNPVKEI